MTAPRAASGSGAVAALLAAACVVVPAPVAAAAPAPAPASAPTLAPTPPPAIAPVEATPIGNAPPSVEPPVDLLDADGSAAHEQRSVTWTLRIDAPEALQKMLTRYLDLARFQGAAEAERITRVELARLLVAAAPQARALLETEGYFNARVTAQVSGDPLPSAEPSAETAKPLPLAVVLQVEPGERTHVGRVRVVIQGPLADAGGAADAADATAASTGRDRSAAELSRQLQQDWKLGVGSAYGQSAWTDAKDALLLAARTEGYALASLSGSAAEVDTATNRADLYVVLDSGPLFRFGEVRFEGLEHVDESTMRAMQTFTPGMTLREKQLLDYQERLVKSSLFDTVAVQYEPDVALAGAMPITVRVTEHALQQATFGVGVSDITGPRITIEHLHQRPLDFSWQARTRLQLGRNAQSLQLDLTSHPRPGGPFRNLFSAAVSQTDASGLRVTSQRVRLGRSQETDNLERTVFVEVQRAATRDLTTQVNTDDTTAATLNYNWLLRALDDTILPTEGYAFSAETGVGRSFATAAGANTNDLSGYFARGLARLTGYLPLGQSWYGQARLQVGQVVARERIAVPFTLLFRAGGDESVRGYGYQTLGPANRDGSAAGGRVLGTASVEIARPISRNLPAWWWAAFYDLGNAATGWDTYRIDQGYGLGLRWRSPVGPLRIDLAYGAAVRHLRLHFNVGLTF